MRHSQRHASYAVSTVLGLAAPALAALLLTSSTEGVGAADAAPLPTPPTTTLVHEVEARTPAAAPAAAPAVHPTVTVAQALRRPAVAPRRVVRTAPVRTAPARTAPARTAPVSAAPKPVSQTAQPAGVDDYPFKSASWDSWSFTARQCVSFVAWRLHQHGHDMGANAGASWGSAYNWDSEARAKGDVVTSVARVGEVAQWNADESSPYYGPGSSTANGRFVAGGYGHVAWVKAVYADGSALVEQYNMGNSQAYSVMRVKAPRYLVIS